MMDSEQFTTLAQKFIDGTIDDTEAAELHKAIEESAELREILRIQVSMHAMIVRRYRRRNVTVNRRVQAALRDPSQKKGAITRIMDKLEAKRPKKKSEKLIALRQPSDRERPPRRNFFLAAAAIALVLILPAFLYQFLGRPAVDPDDEAWNVPATAVPVARAKPSGFAFVSRNGKVLKLKREQALVTGDKLVTSGTGSVALEYPDKTNVSMSKDFSCELQPSELKDEAGIAISFMSGDLDAVVQPQPAGKPMVIHTPQGRATVVGTRFRMSSNPSRLRLEVDEGKVRFSNLKTSESVLVEKGQSAVLSPDVAFEAAPTTRDPALWPFNAQSPWNMPVGSAAQFVAVDSPRFDPLKGIKLAVDEDAIPIYVASASDPMRLSYRNEKAKGKELRVPANAKPETSALHMMNVVDERHSLVYEFLQVANEKDGAIHLGSNSFFNGLHRMGVYDDNKQHGSRMYGGSSMGGIVRYGELSGGIRHALGIGVSMAALNSSAPSGRPYVWPACYASSESDRLYGKSGNLHLGSLLAIPPNVDIRTIGVGTSGPAFEIARALQDYGAYVVDHSDEMPHDMKLYFEPRAEMEIPKELGSQLAKVLGLLKVVANNSATAVGGGGNPRRQLAPPFAKEFEEGDDTARKF